MTCLCPMSEKCLSKDVHSGVFLKKSVVEFKTDGFQWVCSILGTSPHWSTRGHPEIEAEQGFFAGVFPTHRASGMMVFTVLCSVLPGQERGKEDRREKRSSDEQDLR